MNFLEISGLLFWASILICLIMLLWASRNAQTESNDIRIYEKEKARRNDPLTLERLLDGERDAAEIEWNDSQITYKDLTDSDELI